MSETPALHTALVIKSTGSWYTLHDDLSGERIEARLPGRIRLQGRRSTNPLVVGDRVEYRPETNVSGEGGPATAVIEEILPRNNYIIRRASNLSHESHILAANLDQALLVATLGFPETNFEFIDRFLVTAEAYHIPAAVVLNKCDLYDTEELRERLDYFRGIYRGAGYEILETAASLGKGIGPLRERLQGRVTLLSGNSGVGKSTLIRAVDPALEPKVGAISDYHHKGRHTTTFSEMYPLQGGGWLIDSPGIKGFGLIDLEGAEVARYFPDLFALSKGCAYHNCTHTHEPGCAVKEALEQGTVSESRYISYLKLLEEDGGKYR